MNICKHLNAALSKAVNLSSRSSIAWALIDTDSNLIAYDAIKAGSNSSTLANAILENSHNSKKLYISVEPTSGFFDLNELTKTIEQSSIKEIVLGHKLTSTAEDKNWATWCEEWGGEIRFSVHPGVSNKISLGIEKLKRFNLPWITAVTAANLSGAPLKLNDLVNDFGFISFVNDLRHQASVIMVSSNQNDFFESLTSKDILDNHVECYSILDVNKVRSILKHCATEYRSHAVIFCDMQTLAFLIDNDLVDEIVHHTKNIESNKNFSNIQQYHQQSDALLKLKDWNLLQSSVVGDCSQTILSRQVFEDESGFLKGRLN